MQRLVLVLLPAVLAGCAMGWSRPNTSDAEFYQDRVNCEGQAAAAYPPMMVTAGGGQGPAQTRCTTSYGIINCTTTPGIVMPGYTSDANAINRSSMFSACMRGRGYEFKIGN